MTISGFTAYVKQLWKNKPDTSTPLSADRLTHMESGIKGNSDAIEKIAAAVVSQITNDSNKIASMAALYSVNKRVDDTNSNLNRTKEMEIPGGNSAQIYFTCSGSKRAVFVVSGAYGADHTLHDVIPVNIPGVTGAGLSTIANIMHLGSYKTMTIYAAKVSDGKYRIKLAGLTSSLHGVVTGNCEIDRIVYAAD